MFDDSEEEHIEFIEQIEDILPARWDDEAKKELI